MGSLDRGPLPIMKYWDNYLALSTQVSYIHILPRGYHS